MSQSAAVTSHGPVPAGGLKRLAALLPGIALLLLLGYLGKLT